VAETARQTRRVRSASAGALQAGVRPGQTVALAQASVPGLTIVEADPGAEAAALSRLAVWALRYTPLAAPDGEDGLVLDTTGADHLLGGEAALLSDLLARLRKAGLSVRGALSSSRSLSSGLARYGSGTDGPGRLVPQGGEGEAAAALPVAALGLPRDRADALARLGLGRIGALRAAPRASLALRFGPELTAALDRLHGHRPEPFEPVSVPDRIAARLVLAEPIAHSAGVEAALAKLSAELCRKLAARGQGVRVADLRCERVDGEILTLRARAAVATQDADHLCRLFRETAATIDPGFGIERLTLLAVRAGRKEARQRTTENDTAQPLPPLVDRIAARIGPGRVYRIAPTEADLPERSCRLAGPLARPSPLVWDRGPRPTFLFAPPEPVQVLALLPDRPPRRFTWRGRQHRVARADGPECMLGEWWRTDAEAALTRDYYHVETEEGGRYWLFRARDASLGEGAAGAAEWFMHGVFA